MQGIFSKKMGGSGETKEESAGDAYPKKTHYRPKLSSYLPDLTLYFRPRQQKSLLIYFALGEKAGGAFAPPP